MLRELLKRLLEGKRRSAIPPPPPAPRPRSISTRVEEPTITLANLFRAAYERGRADGALGKTLAQNPYDDRRSAGGGSPMNRGNIVQWRAGWREGHLEFMRRRNRSVELEDYRDI